jgi:phosphatidylglycerophosphatase A
VSGIRIALATWFGCGYSPLVPGTVGTLGAVPLVLLLWWRGGWPAHIAAIVVVTAVGVWAADGAERHFGVKDPKPVVIDEVAGMLVATFPLFQLRWPWFLALSFVLFRAFDILKPWPARSLERLPGGWGIMADDLVAGLYANLLLLAPYLLKIGMP